MLSLPRAGVGLLLLSGGAVALPGSDEPPLFVDAAAAARLDFRHSSGASAEKHIYETMGSGGGFLDYDNDGRLDVYLVNTAGPNRLFHGNPDGTFTDVTAKAGVDGGGSVGMGCSFADYDNDGFVDIYVTNLGPNILYHNNGDGTFTDVTAKAGVGDPLWSTSAVWADYDHDGYLDLYVCNYLRFSRADHRRCSYHDVPIYCYPHSYDGAPNTLYHNNRDGTFTDSTARAGVREDPRASKSLGAIWFDMDGDGDADLYVANDTTPNFLFENKGNGTFADISLVSGAAFGEAGVAKAGMGVDAADLDGSGRFHVFVTNFSFETNTLFWNEGGGRFSDRSIEAGLAGPSFVPLGFGANFLDYDNDGLLDLFVANGHVFDNAPLINPSTEYRQVNQLFHNLGLGRFQEVTGSAGPCFARKDVGRGSAAGDYDNDGRVDLLVMNNNGAVVLLHNQARARSWLGMKLRGAHCNRDAVGARVTVEAAGYRLTQEVRAGSSYMSQSDLRLHFGLGSRTQVNAIRVTWPCGKRQEVAPPAALNRYLLVTEPS